MPQTSTMDDPVSDYPGAEAPGDAPVDDNPFAALIPKAPAAAPEPSDNPFAALIPKKASTPSVASAAPAPVAGSEDNPFAALIPPKTSPQTTGMLNQQLRDTGVPTAAPDLSGFTLQAPKPPGKPESPAFLSYLDASNKKFDADQRGDTDASEMYSRQMAALEDQVRHPSTISPISQEDFESAHEKSQPPSTLGQMVAKPLAGYGQFGAAALGTLGNVPAAIAGYTKPGEELAARQDLGEQMPIEQRATNLPAQVTFGLAKSAPKMAAIALAPEAAAAVGISGTLASMAAGGGLFGLDDQGNFTARDAAFGALFPAVGAIGRRAASEAILKAAQTGIPIPNEVGQQIVKSVGSQVAQGAWQLSQNSDKLTQEYYSDKDAFNKSMADIIGSNLGYALFGALSETPEIRAFADKQAKDLVQYVPPPPTRAPAFTAPAKPLAPISEIAKPGEMSDLDKLQADLAAKEAAAAASKEQEATPTPPDSKAAGDAEFDRLMKEKGLVVIKDENGKQVDVRPAAPGEEPGVKVMGTDIPSAPQTDDERESLQKQMVEELDRLSVSDPRHGEIVSELNRMQAPKPVAPAIQQEDGTILAGKPGEEHKDIIAREVQNGILANGEKGFISGDGQFLTRDEAGKALGITGPLDSQTLNQINQHEQIRQTQEPVGPQAGNLPPGGIGGEDRTGEAGKQGVQRAGGGGEEEGVNPAIPARGEAGAAKPVAPPFTTPAKPSVSPPPAGIAGNDFRQGPPEPGAKLKLYHGTQHDVDEFDTAKIGTGQGFQGFGWGLYFAEEPKVADSYRPYKEDLVDKFQRAGNRYTVSIDANDDELMDWDKPLSQQSEKVQAAMRRFIDRETDDLMRRNPKHTTREAAERYALESWSAAKFYEELSQVYKTIQFGKMHPWDAQVAGEKMASEYLAANGIKGVRYLDAKSRLKGEGTRNYVIFDPKDIKITENNGKPVTMEQARAEQQDQPAARLKRQKGQEDFILPPAVAKGKPVPPEVLADYPDLQKANPNEKIVPQNPNSGNAPVPAIAPPPAETTHPAIEPSDIHGAATQQAGPVGSRAGEPNFPEPVPHTKTQPLPANAVALPHAAPLIGRILDAFEAPERARYRPVQRVETKGTDGNWYTLGFPRGVDPTNVTRKFWVMQDVREGTTHGKRYETQEALEAARNVNLAARRKEFEHELNKMSSEQLDSQAQYWLKNPKAPTPTPTPVSPKKPKAQRKLPTPNSISDFRPGIDKVERRGDRTFVVDSEGQRAPIEVQSDKLTPETEANLRKLPRARLSEFRATTAQTPYLSPEGKAERLAIFDEMMGTPPSPSNPVGAKSAAEPVKAQADAGKAEVPQTGGLKIQPAPEKAPVQGGGEVHGFGGKIKGAAAVPPEDEPQTPAVTPEDAKALTQQYTPGLDPGRPAILSLLFPTLKSPEHLKFAEMLGARLGAMHHAEEVAGYQFKAPSLAMDRLGVHRTDLAPGDNPGIKLMSDMSQGRPVDPQFKAAVDYAERLFDQAIDRLEAADAPLQKVREHYFPGMWTSESRRAFNAAMEKAAEDGMVIPDVNKSTPEQRAQIKALVDRFIDEGKGSDKDMISYFTRRPMKGRESFRKGKVFDDILIAAEFGLRPVSNNPFDLIKAKLAEMGKSVMANEFFNKDLKPIGAIQTISPYEQPPEGWVYVNDRYGTIYGPPTVEIPEHVDKAVYDGLTNFAKSIGVKHERSMNFPGGPGTRALGLSYQGKNLVRTKFATPMNVLSHEIGHQLDEKYGLWNAMTGGERGNERNSPVQKELRAIADLTGRPEGPSHSKAEKIAQMVEAYVYAPDMMKEVAPILFQKFDDFIQSHEELAPLGDIRPGLEVTKLFSEKYVGLPIVGRRIVPAACGDILNNYLSSSLYNNAFFGKPYRAWMFAANELNQSQLGGASMYHAGFTAGEAQTSAAALLVKDAFGLVRGNRGPIDLAKTTGNWMAAMARNPYIGNRVLNAWRNPDGVMDPRIAQVVRAAELAGGGFKLEKGFQTEHGTQMVRDWYSGHQIKAAARSPLAFIEMLAKPTMEWIVPRQKAGVFAELAWRIIQMYPGKTLEELAPQFRQAWNRLDARLGQVRYDRLFMNNIAKSLVQAGIRSPGWSGGTIAEIGGAFPDAVNFFRDWHKTGKMPQDIPDRVAYLIGLALTMGTANAVLTYLFTGKKPHGMDFVAFRTGAQDQYGNDERFMLPSYVKDIWSYARHPLTTLSNKGHPILSMAGELYRNKNYYGTEIIHHGAGYVANTEALGGYVAKQFVPFWMRALSQERERNASLAKQVVPFVGIMPAPSSMTQTPAMQALHEYFQSTQPVGARTAAQADASAERRDLTDQMRQGKDMSDQIKAEYNANKLTLKQVNNLMNLNMSAAGKNPALSLEDFAKMVKAKARDGWMSMTEANKLYREKKDGTIEGIPDQSVLSFKRLPLDIASKVYQLGNPEEKALWLKPLQTKIANAEKGGVLEE